MGQSFLGAQLRSASVEPSVYRAIDGTLFTVNEDGKAVGLDGAALSPVPSGNVYLAGTSTILTAGVFMLTKSTMNKSFRKFYPAVHAMTIILRNLSMPQTFLNHFAVTLERPFQ